MSRLEPSYLSQWARKWNTNRKSFVAISPFIHIRKGRLISLTSSPRLTDILGWPPTYFYRFYIVLYVQCSKVSPILTDGSFLMYILSIRKLIENGLTIFAYSHEVGKRNFISKIWDLKFYLVFGGVLHLDTIVIPGNLRERVGHDGAVEDESVPPVFLLDGGLLGEGGGGAVHLRLRGGIHSWNTSTM